MQTHRRARNEEGRTWHDTAKPQATKVYQHSPDVGKRQEDPSPESSQRSWACRPLEFSPASRTERGYISVGVNCSTVWYMATTGIGVGKGGGTKEAAPGSAPRLVREGEARPLGRAPRTQPRGRSRNGSLWSWFKTDEERAGQRARVC